MNFVFNSMEAGSLESRPVIEKLLELKTLCRHRRPRRKPYDRCRRHGYRYFGEQGTLGVLVKLNNPPDWYVEGNRGDPIAHLYGVDLNGPGRM
ncbi:hypothetical protein [Bradyrhizobium sp. sGM-13]|uniref:hypothetical protein n=1 Tax=Bradyrhizobium sp. sGM-13 TaxID=2831781 RepID=UPI001BCD0B14|nr:hypothetical protein [Bradyrhizobium sp. sGM-13]